MTEEQIKEAISRRYVELVASRAGFKCQQPTPDNGVDMSVSRAVPRAEGDGVRYYDDGKYLDVQLKCTVQSQVVFAQDHLKFDLEAKAFNDLVQRRIDQALVPLILVVLVLPDDAATWVTVGPEQLVVQRCAFWFQPDQNTERTENSSSIRISIPLANMLDLDFFEDRIKEAYS